MNAREGAEWGREKLNCRQTLWPLRAQRVSGLLEKRLDWAKWEGGGMRGCLDGGGSAGEMERRLCTDYRKCSQEEAYRRKEKKKYYANNRVLLKNSKR